MKRIMMVLAVIGILVMGVGSSVGADNDIQVQVKEGIGNYLADSEGMTLYWFKKDTPGKSACAGPCLEKWPIFYRETVMAEDLSSDDFGTITREGGEKQTTFREYPLYYWVNDKQAGDTSGQNVNNVWFVIDPDNFPPK